MAAPISAIIWRDAYNRIDAELLSNLEEDGTLAELRDVAMMFRGKLDR